MNVGRAALLAVLAICASSTFAAEQQVVTIKGVVYAAIPCVINNNKPFTQPFGDVQTAGIDGYYKTITLDYSLDCSRSTTNELRMQVRGNDAGFDTSLLLVPGYDNLGVALKKDGTRLAINTWSDFDTNKKPVLQAVLVKRQNSDIKAGVFKASATLVVDYR
ncbi:Pilin (type 1 fimbria component protein) [Pseudomonas mucidolens]|uniref:Pilin (Type 1 fimbria component protein) n=2 Tax=Pseudomonas mucidolens TaxID=46679 RepID=A0A1H2N489_9PSED|nr:Pilin (type 1 fimbria component protein) [Pseudomonas mucidolens]SQH32764.1 putative exported fimbrial protein [Pseudomonas mucidolens]